MSRPEAPASQVFGEWRIGPLLGRGGMGEVYLAERIGGDFEQQGALKLVRRGLDSDEVLARFLRERQILARLSHPGIASLLDGGVTPAGQPYFVLERVEGEPITDYVRAQRLDPRAILRLFLRVLDAVEAAHRALVVHRDLKPSNLFVTAAGAVKLLDFGIAKELADDGSGTTTRLGEQPLTPAYAAPEQLHEGRVTTATDVYSLGVVLHELLLGNRDAPAPGPLVGDLRDLAAIVARARAADPALRYPTVAAFAADVRAFLDGRPVAARGTSRGYRLRTFARRHRVALGAAITLFVVLVASTLATLAQARQAAREARRAERTQEFLVGLFEAIDPTRTRGEEVTARQVLDEGAHRLERELLTEVDGRGSLAGSVADALARTYRGLNVLDEAARWADRAVAENTRAFGPRARGTLNARLSHAEVEISRSHPAEAAAELTELIPLIAAEFGVESLESLRARRNLATAAGYLGDHEAARRARRELLPLAEKLLGPDSQEAAGLVIGIGIAELSLSQFAAAEAALRDGLERFRRGGSADTPTALKGQMVLADLLDAIGRGDEVLPLLTDAVDRARRALGPGHAVLGGALHRYGFALLNRGNPAGSRAALHESARIFEALNHPDAAEAWRFLCNADFAEQRYAEAEVLCRRAAEWLAVHAGEDHVTTWGARGNHAQQLMKLGRLTEAEVAQRRVIAALTRLEGPESNFVRSPKKDLGETLRRLGRVEEAEALHREVLAIETKLFGDKMGRQRAATYLQLAQDEEARGNRAALDRAQALADDVLAFYRGPQGDALRLGTTLVLTGRLAAARGDLARARKELAEAETLLRDRVSARGPTWTQLQKDLARLGRRAGPGRVGGND